MSTSDMQKRTHVPKFGDWNNKGGNIVPYTAVFDKARKGKMKEGVKMINPNDPEENPEAFAMVEKDKVKEGVLKLKLPAVTEDSRGHSSESEAAASRSLRIGLSSRFSHHRRRSDESEISACSEKMSFECNTSSFLLRRQQWLRERSEKRKSMDASSKISTGSNGHHCKRSSITDMDMIQPIPKFGDWDEGDPKSGEDYTFKFNKVKKENKNISEIFTAALSSESKSGRNTNNRGKFFSISKIFCFHLFPRGRS